MGHFYWTRTSEHRWETVVGNLTMAIVRVSEKNWKGSVHRANSKQPYNDATPNFNKRTECADALLKQIGKTAPGFHTFGAANKTPADEHTAAAAAHLPPPSDALETFVARGQAAQAAVDAQVSSAPAKKPRGERPPKPKRTPRAIANIG